MIDWTKPLETDEEDPIPVDLDATGLNDTAYPNVVSFVTPNRSRTCYQCDHLGKLMNGYGGIRNVKESDDSSYKEMLHDALECVDKCFQSRSDREPPILPDFCLAGDNKFEAVVRLARDYAKLSAQLEKCKKIIGGEK